MQNIEHVNINLKEEHILITGGLGFIGSHVIVQILQDNKNVIIIDNLANSNLSILDDIHRITNKGENIVFIKGDIRDKNILLTIFDKYNINSVLHFAALKSVSESEKYPDLYYDVNVNGTKNIINVMKIYGCNNFIYSSSATVYGNSAYPVTENSLTGNDLTCNYARNKYEIEEFLINEHKNSELNEWNIAILRYFNPIGAHPSGIIGENPQGVPNNIFPYLLRVAKYNNVINKKIDITNTNPYLKFTVFGDNYNTRDGTCIRDYIHIQDLARAHIEVLKYLKLSNSSIKIYNVGTGNGTTVFELINALNNQLDKMGIKKIDYIVGNRRAGDLDISYANVDKIYKDIGFKTEYNINDMCRDGLNFVFNETSSF